jgi:hypothetical protein
MGAGNLPTEPPSTYRVAGGLMIGSGLMNGGLALVWVLSLGLMCVGLLWIVPFAVAVGEVLVGLLMVLGVPVRFGPVAAVAGIVNGTLLLSPPAVVMQVTALVFLRYDEALRFVALTGPTESEAGPAHGRAPPGDRPG